MVNKTAVSISLDSETLKMLDALKVVFNRNRSVIVREAVYLLWVTVEQSMMEGDD